MKALDTFMCPWLVYSRWQKVVFKKKEVVIDGYKGISGGFGTEQNIHIIIIPA